MFAAACLMRDKPFRSPVKPSSFFIAFHPRSDDNLRTEDILAATSFPIDGSTCA
jgi:hypothetical protein